MNLYTKKVILNENNMRKPILFFLELSDLIKICVVFVITYFLLRNRVDQLTTLCCSAMTAAIPLGLAVPLPGGIDLLEYIRRMLHFRKVPKRYAYLPLSLDDEEDLLTEETEDDVKEKRFL